jgi:hypothetical protein
MKTIFCLLAVLIPLIGGNIPTERGLNWYENLPAVAMDYKVHIDAGNLIKNLQQ